MRIALTLMCAVAILTTSPAAGQTQPAGDKKATKTWKLQRTPDGQPDFQGVWTNASLTPLERPKSLGAKEFYTPQEFADMQKLEASRADVALLGRGTEPGTADDVHYDLSQFGLDRAQSKEAASLRTSLIVGPEGRVPPLLPEARKRAADAAAKLRGHEFDGPESRPLMSRCLVMTYEVLPMLPQGYNNNIQIMQAQGSFTITHEMNHSVRIIPLDGRPHLPSNIRQWRGDSRGHWEGDTLVVDATNFAPGSPFRGSGEKLHVVERFTRTGEETILYQFTVDDPTTWDKPWGAEVLMAKVGGAIYEFACHEGNYALANTLRGARVAEEDAAAAKKAAK